ncbi:MAG: ATP-binding protein [Acidiferrobacterales bacterium]
MKRLIPQSLFGRLALVLFFGLLLAQLASTAIQFRDRGQRVFQASGLYSAERIAEIVRLLDGANTVERNRLVSLLNVPPLRVSLTTPAWSGPDKTVENWPVIEFRKRLLLQLGDNYPLRVAVSDQPTSDATQNMHDSGGHNMQHTQRMGMALPDALVFFAQVKLSDGTWVSFENSIAEEVFADSSTLLLLLAILVTIVLSVSLLAVRWVTRPLTMLTQAANKLGGDINQPPLSETGPMEVRLAANAFNSMQTRLQKFIEDRTGLLTAISHDLKTPITRMRIRAEMLDDPEQRASFTKNLDEMQLIASETLDFLRADDAREPLQATDICALLEAIRDDAAELGQRVDIEPCMLKPFHARPLALKRCIGNLVENAIKYGGNARVSAHESKQVLVITIADSGPGIPQQKLETVFEPFYRLETSRSRETGGSGLGLSIARNIALSHGGDLRLVNNPNGGLQAILTLLRNSK